MNIRTIAGLTILKSCFTIASNNTDNKENQPMNKDSLSCSSTSRTGSIIGHQSTNRLTNKKMEGIEANKDLSEDWCTD
jgi:hypothetical protein